jgi:hypothetical protein
VTFDQLKSGIACFIPGVSPITLVNNSGNTWSTSKGNISPGQKITISPNETISIGGQNYGYTSLATMDTNKNGILQISGSQQQTIYITQYYSVLKCYLDTRIRSCYYRCQNPSDFRTCDFVGCWDRPLRVRVAPIKPDTCDGVRDWYINTYYPDGEGGEVYGFTYRIDYLTEISYPSPVYEIYSYSIPQTVLVPVITDL